MFIVYKVSEIYMFMNCGVVGNVADLVTLCSVSCLILFLVIYIHPWATP